jgi:ribonuclease P protein component
VGEFGFGKSKRLLNASEYSAVFDAAEFKVSEKTVLCLARRSQLNQPRVGLVIAKKNVRLAVQRNRVKRVIRESFRHNATTLHSCDIVILARRGLGDLKNPEMNQLLMRIWQKLARKVENSVLPESIVNQTIISRAL